MRKFIFLISFFLILNKGQANNLLIGEPIINGNTIQFTIQWDNSWRVSIGPSNWDAVWVFVKRQTCNQAAQNPWLHANLDATASNHSIADPDMQVDLASDKKGVFIHRANDGVGNVAQTTVTLTLASAINSDNIQVIGIEMVYVPEGEFYIGDGNVTNNASSNWYMGDASSNPVLISSSLLATYSGGMPKSVYGGGPTAYGSTVSLPSTFPFGYNAFYCMKYEITVDLFIAFLNSLTYDQQLHMQETGNWNTNPPTSPRGTSFTSRYGYKILIDTPAITTNMLKPAVYGADANANSIYNEDCDGLGLAITLNKLCFLAFLDWAAIRPMSEFEYEKACRGPLPPVLNECPWGTTDLTKSYGTITNRYCSNETSSANALGLANVYASGSGTAYRVGIEATATSDRVHAGATYYGILNMAGGTFERCLGGWSYDYSSFTTLCGDGSLASDGQTDMSIWKSSTYVLRGSSYSEDFTYKMSRRAQADEVNNALTKGYGGRGVRSN